MTASGDKTLALWDTSSAICIGACYGHVGSVKTVCASSKSPNVLASGEMCLRAQKQKPACDTLVNASQTELAFSRVTMCPGAFCRNFHEITGMQAAVMELL